MKIFIVIAILLVVAYFVITYKNKQTKQSIAETPKEPTETPQEKEQTQQLVQKSTTNFPTLEYGDIVKYTLTEEECIEYDKPIGCFILAKVLTVFSKDEQILIRTEIRPGQGFQKNVCFGMEPGMFQLLEKS